MSITECVVSNLAIASMLALAAAVVGKVTTKPQVTHALWLLVLVKLVTPPIVHIPVSNIFSESPTTLASKDSIAVKSRSLSATLDETIQPPEERRAQPQMPGSSPMPHAASATNNGEHVQMPSPPVVLWTNTIAGVWIAGSVVWFLLASTRLFRFKRVLRYARPGSQELLAEIRSVATRYGSRIIPRVLIVDAHVPPLIGSFGRHPTMVLPNGLLSKLGKEARARLFAHELAHLKRHDHWIRWFEFAVLTIYWWNPVAWWARRQIQQAEEECCDGWVLWAFPENARLYAQTLLDTVEFLSGSTEPQPDIVTAFNQGHSLKRRIEMIIGDRLSHQLSWKIRAVLVLSALAVIPLSLLGSEGGGSNRNVTIREETTVSSDKEKLSEKLDEVSPTDDPRILSEAEQVDTWNRLSGKETDEIARRHLGLVATAALGYAGEHEGRLPPLAVPNPQLPEEKRLSGLVLLLPYLGVRPAARYMSDKAWEKQRHILEDSDLAGRARKIYERIDLKKAWDDPENDEAARTIVWKFLIPGSGSPRNDQGYAVSNIAFCRGFGGPLGLPVTDGAFDSTGVRLGQIRDGYSQTLGLGQIYTKLGPWIAAGSSSARYLYGFHDRVRFRETTFGSRHGAACYFAWVDSASDRFFLDLDDTADAVVQALACRSDGISMDHTRDVHYYPDVVTWEANKTVRIRVLADKITLWERELEALRRRDDPIPPEQAAPYEAEIKGLRERMQELNGPD